MKIRFLIHKIHKDSRPSQHNANRSLLCKRHVCARKYTRAQIRKPQNQNIQIARKQRSLKHKCMHTHTPVRAHKESDRQTHTAAMMQFQTSSSPLTCLQRRLKKKDFLLPWQPLAVCREAKTCLDAKLWPLPADYYSTSFPNFFFFLCPCSSLFLNLKMSIRSNMVGCFLHPTARSRFQTVSRFLCWQWIIFTLSFYFLFTDWSNNLKSSRQCHTSEKTSPYWNLTHASLKECCY